MYILSNGNCYNINGLVYYYINYAKRVQQSLHWWYHGGSHHKWGGYGDRYSAWFNFWSTYQRKPLTSNGEKIVDMIRPGDLSSDSCNQEWAYNLT